MNHRLVAAVCAALLLAVSSDFAAEENPFGAGGSPAQAVALIKRSAYVTPDFRPSEEKILEELSNKTQLEFGDNPQSLKDVVDFIRTKHNIEVMLDAENLHSAGIDP